MYTYNHTFYYVYFCVPCTLSAGLCRHPAQLAPKRGWVSFFIYYKYTYHHTIYYMKKDEYYASYVLYMYL